MPQTPKESVVPPGGHHFIEKREGHPDQRIEGGSYKEVAERLLGYRLANGFPPGNPLGEVHAYVCGNWPHFCDEPVPLAVPDHNPKAPAPAHLSYRVLQFLNQLWRRQAGAPRELAGDMLARQRAEVCARCPRQRSWTDGGCGTCIEQAQRVGYVYRAGRNSGIDKELLGCTILGQDNRTAVWSQNLPDITPEQRAELPPTCWRIRPELNP